MSQYQRIHPFTRVLRETASQTPCMPRVYMNIFSSVLNRIGVSCADGESEAILSSGAQILMQE